MRARAGASMSTGGGRHGKNWQRKCMQRMNARLRAQHNAAVAAGYRAEPPVKPTVWERIKGWFK